MSEEHRRRRGSPEDFISNWREYEGSTAKKLALTARNLALRVKLQGCCGHDGEPGC